MLSSAHISHISHAYLEHIARFEYAHTITRLFEPIMSKWVLFMHRICSINKPSFDYDSEHLLAEINRTSGSSFNTCEEVIASLSDLDFTLSKRHNKLMANFHNNTLTNTEYKDLTHLDTVLSRNRHFIRCCETILLKNKLPEYIRQANFGYSEILKQFEIIKNVLHYDLGPLNPYFNELFQEYQHAIFNFPPSPFPEYDVIDSIDQELAALEYLHRVTCIMPLEHDPYSRIFQAKNINNSELLSFCSTLDEAIQTLISRPDSSLIHQHLHHLLNFNNEHITALSINC